MNGRPVSELNFDGVETNAAKDAQESVKWFRDAINFLCEYVRAQKYDLKFALEPKPNEPRGFGATTTQPRAAQSAGFHR